MSQYPQNIVISTNKIQPQQIINQQQPISSQPFATRVINNNVGFSKDLYRKVVGYNNQEMDCYNPSNRLNTVNSKSSYNQNPFVLPQEKLLSFTKLAQNLQTNQTNNGLYQQQEADQRLKTQIITPQNAISHTHSLVNTARSSNINVVIKKDINKHLSNICTDTFLSAREVNLEQRCSQNQKQLQQLQNSIKPILAQKNIQNEINTKNQQILKVSVNSNFLYQQQPDLKTFQSKENFQQKAYQKENTDIKNTSRQNSVLLNGQNNLDINQNSQISNQFLKMEDLERSNIAAISNNLGDGKLTQRRTSIYFQGQDQVKYDFAQNNIYRQNEMLIEQQFQQSQSQQEQISNFNSVSQNFKNNQLLINEKNTIQQQSQQQYQQVNCFLNNPYTAYSQKNQFESIQTNRMQEYTQKLTEQSSVIQNVNNVSVNNTFQSYNNKIFDATNSQQVVDFCNQQNQFQAFAKNQQQNQYLEINSQISQTAGNQQFNSRKPSYKQDIGGDDFQLSINQLRRVQDKTPQNAIQEQVQCQNSKESGIQYPYLYLVPQKIARQRNKTTTNHPDQNFRNVKTSSNNLSVYMQTAYTNRSHDIATNYNQLENSYMNEITPTSTRSNQQSQILPQNTQFQQRNYIQNEQQLTHLDQISNFNSCSHRYSRIGRQNTDFNGAEMQDNSNYYQFQESNPKQYSNIYNYQTNQSISQVEFQQIQKIKMTNNMDSSFYRQSNQQNLNLNTLNQQQQQYDSNILKLQDIKANNYSFYQDQMQNNNQEQNKSDINGKSFQNELSTLKKIDTQNYDQISKSIDEILKNFNFKTSNQLSYTNTQINYQTNAQEQPFQQTETLIPIKRDSFSAFNDQNQLQLNQNYKTNVSSQRQSFLNGQNNSFTTYLGLDKFTPNNQSQIDYASQNYSQISSIQLAGNKIVDDCKSDTPFSNRFLGVRKSSRSLYVQNLEKESDLIKQNEQEKQFQIQNKINQQNQQLIKDTTQNQDKADQIQTETQQSDYNSIKTIANNEHQIPNQTISTKLNQVTFQQTGDSIINSHRVNNKDNKNIDLKLENQVINSICNLKCYNSSHNNNDLIRKRSSSKSFLQPSNLEKQSQQDELLNCNLGNQQQVNVQFQENQIIESKTEQENKVNTFSKKRGFNTQIIKNLLLNVVESKSLSNSFRQNNLSKNSNSSANYDGKSITLGQANSSQSQQPITQHQIKNSFILKNKLPHQEKSQKNNQSLNLKQKIVIAEKNTSLNSLNQNSNINQKLNSNGQSQNNFNYQINNENQEENVKQKTLTNNNKSCDIQQQQQITKIYSFKNKETGSLESHLTDPCKSTFNTSSICDSKIIKKEIIPQSLLNFDKEFKEEIPKSIRYRNSKSEIEISQQASQINQKSQLQKQQLILNTLITNKPINQIQQETNGQSNIKNQNQQTQSIEISNDKAKKGPQNGSFSKAYNKKKSTQNQSQHFQSNQSSNESFKHLKSNNSLTQTINLLLNNFNERQSLEKKENKKLDDNTKLKSARNSLELNTKASQDNFLKNSEISQVKQVQVVNKSLKGSFINSQNNFSNTANIDLANNQLITQQTMSQNQAEKDLQNQKKVLTEQQLRLSQIEGEMQKQQIQIIPYEYSMQVKQQKINSQRNQSEYEYRQNILSDLQNQSATTNIKQLNDNSITTKQNLNVMTFCNKDQNFFMNELSSLANDENLPPHNLNQNDQMFPNAFNNESIQDKTKQSQKIQYIKSNNQMISYQKTTQEKENQNFINLNENNSQNLQRVSVPLANRNSSLDFFKGSISPFSQPYSSTSNTSPSASSLSFFNLHSVSQNNQQVQVSFKQLPPTLTIEEQIQMFDLEEKLKKPEIQFQTVEEIQNLMEVEMTYYIDYTIFNKHNQFNHQSRFVLVDWMQRQCMKFYLKRETTHKAIFYLDLYFSKIQNIKEDKYYIIAIACIFIASKQEEIYPPSLNDILSGSQYASQKNLISQQEIEIIKNLKWKLNPITACYWMDLAMAQWDRIQLLQNKSYIFFRKRDEQSYKRYREAYQFLDFILLDSNKMKNSLRLISITSIYLVICKQYAINPDQPNNEIDQIFQEQSYLQMFQLNINQIKQCSKELNSSFTSLTYEFDYPNAIKQNNFNQKSYEEFLSFQSYSQLNKQNLEI
ncbi:hypothetical protein ABPG74_016168 [Tetrahymena malaccensis]